MANTLKAEFDNPHDYEVRPTMLLVRGDLLKRFCIVDKDGGLVGLQLYASHDAASDAIGRLIAEDDEDKRLHRHRHEPGPDEPASPSRFGASYGANSAGRT